MHAFCQAKDLQKGAQILASDDQSLLEAGEFHGRICFYHILEFRFPREVLDSPETQTSLELLELSTEDRRLGSARNHSISASVMLKQYPNMRPLFGSSFGQNPTELFMQTTSGNAAACFLVRRPFSRTGSTGCGCAAYRHSVYACCNEYPWPQHAA